jgi:hypothetical protein
MVARRFFYQLRDYYRIEDQNGCHTGCFAKGLQAMAVAVRRVGVQSFRVVGRTRLQADTCIVGATPVAGVAGRCPPRLQPHPRYLRNKTE